jgi:hypothetical protein
MVTLSQSYLKLSIIDHVLEMSNQVWMDSQWMKCATTEKGISSEKRKLLLTNNADSSKTLPSQSSPENEYACIDDGLRSNFEPNFVKNKNRDSCKSMSTFSGFIPTLSNGLEPEPYATTDLLLNNRNSNNSNSSGNNNNSNNNGNNTSGPVYCGVSCTLGRQSTLTLV